jgi:hypothetical protein
VGREAGKTVASENVESDTGCEVFVGIEWDI